MMKNRIFVLLVSLALATQAKDINVADHGIVPGKDATLPLRQLLQSLEGSSGINLVFPEGQYEFYPEHAREAFRAVSNHDNSLKRMAFTLFNGRDISVDGQGSMFMFHGRISPLVIDGTRGATLKNFSIDWKRSFHDELLVVERNDDDNSFIVEADPERYPFTIKFNEVWFERYNWKDPFGANMVFDPKTRSPIYDTRKYSVPWAKPVVATPAGKNRFKIESGVRAAPPIGHVLVTYGVNPTSRLCPAIHVINSSDVVIENVTVYDAGGMGLIVERTDNVSLDHFVVTSTEERMVSTRADATHFVGCKGTIRLENCLFEHMLDDGINVHGAYVRVDEYLGDRQFICAISHPQQWGLTFAEPGDKVALLSRETVLPFFETTVEQVRALNEERMLVTLANVPAQMPTGPLSLENLTWYPDVVMKHNTIRENRARSALITTKGKVLIENNYFSSQMHGILIEGDNKHWYESGAVQDVTIRNNEFVNIGFEGGERYPLFASPMLTPEQRMGEGHYHRNITFADNTLKSFNGLMVFARSVKGLKITGNTLEKSTDYPPASEFPAIHLLYCDDVTISKNRSKGFDLPSIIQSSEDTTGVATGNNEGFETGSR